MRIWDIPPRELCGKHLVAEHAELHGLWSVLTKKKKGYSRHPETLRWEGKLKALYNRHEELVAEMSRRGYRHRSPLDPQSATGKDIQEDYLESPEKQRQILMAKSCACPY